MEPPFYHVPAEKGNFLIHKEHPTSLLSKFKIAPKSNCIKKTVSIIVSNGFLISKFVQELIS